jgi:holo-[acyl-carrier protein] synthase
LILRSGIDLIEIARLDDLQPRIRTRFLQRVFTALELEECEGRSPSLAGRFAAKEAVAKVLGCGIGPVSWQEIEIRRGSNGEPQLQLFGKAQALAQELGLETWSVSISHNKETAVALAVAAGTV